MNNPSAICAIGEELAPYFGRHVDGYLNLSKEQAVYIEETLAAFCLQAASKYVKGQLEHGGSLLDRDCLAEAQLETIDLFWYLSAKQEQEQKTKEKL